MSELFELYLIFLAIYLFECVAWVPRRTVGFFSLLGRWRARSAYRPNASWSIGVVFGKPWPPLGPAWLAEPLPFALDPEGITLTEGDGRRVPWVELEEVATRGHRVVAGGLVLAGTASRAAALTLAEAIEKVRRAPTKKREAQVRELLAARFDPALPRRRQAAFTQSVRALRVTTNLLWCFLFGLLGVAAFTQHLLLLLLAAAASLLLWPIQSMVFWLTLRKLAWLPRAHWPDRAKRLTAVLSPISGLRGADLLAREIWVGLDPVNVAASLLSTKDLAAFARPRLVAVEPRAGDALGWWRAEQRRLVERALAERRIDAAELLAPPLREGPHAETYCPSCLAQYSAGRKPGEPCPGESCPDVPLRTFGDAGKPR